MSDKVEIFATIKADSGAAFLINDGDIDAWIPKSQIEVEGSSPDSYGVGDDIIANIPEWLAIAKGLI